jgi:hypothetical protein
MFHGDRAMTTLPNFNTATFKPGDLINNPYFPLKPGTIFVYEGEPVNEAIGDEVEETIQFATTFQTKNVAGVTATVVRETAWANGFLQEDTEMSGIWVNLLRHLSMTRMVISLGQTTTVPGKPESMVLYRATSCQPILK